MDEKALIGLALRVMENAYAPYSGYRVGACVLAESGKAYSGCNIENASFGATCCAERVALHTALAAGEKRFTHIAIASDSDGPTLPCGICRQVMAELAPDARVLCANRDGVFETYAVKDLLPNAFAFHKKEEESP